MVYWNVILTTLFLIVSLLYNYYVYLYSGAVGEGFQNIFSINSRLQQILKAQQAKSAYSQWLGYLYANPSKASAALNDMKRRVFQPNCKFRMNWPTQLPSGKSVPIGAKSADLANVAYASYLNCLAKDDIGCVMMLDDFRSRFMEPGCEYLRPKDRSWYNADIRPVFS